MKNHHPHSWLFFFLSCHLAISGCAQGDPATSEPLPLTAVAGSTYLLDSEPAGARGVIEVRAAAKDRDEVVVVGRIGGSANPWVEGRAAFSIVDPSIKSCADCGSDDCEKPWDYC